MDPDLEQAATAQQVLSFLSYLWCPVYEIKMKGLELDADV